MTCMQAWAQLISIKITASMYVYLYLYLQYTYVRTYLHIRSYAIYVCNVILIHTQKYLILFNLIIIRISICAVIITYMAMYVYSTYKTWLLRILVNIYCKK